MLVRQTAILVNTKQALLPVCDKLVYTNRNNVYLMVSNFLLHLRHAETRKSKGMVDHLGLYF